MNINKIALGNTTPGTCRELQIWDFPASVDPDDAPKIYLQGSLHADELPGSLVLFHLRKQFEELETEGRMSANFRLVPFCNPIGLSQFLNYSPMGRFDLATQTNFNRCHLDWTDALKDKIKDRIGTDPVKNKSLIRSELKVLLDEWAPRSEAEELRKVLFSLAYDSDVVLDLHCASEGVVHVFSQNEFWPLVEPICRAIGSEVQLLAPESGGGPFDESIVAHWVKLQQEFGKDKVPLGCQAATVEFRGVVDVSHKLAEQDAQNLCLAFSHLGWLDIDNRKPLPKLVRNPMPLSGTDQLYPPFAGMISFHRQPGEWVENGDAVFDVVDPLNNRSVTVEATRAGVIYSRENRRYLLPSMPAALIATDTPFRTGALLTV